MHPELPFDEIENSIPAGKTVAAELSEAARKQVLRAMRTSEIGGGGFRRCVISRPRGPPAGAYPLVMH